MIFTDIIFILNQMETITIFWLLTLLIVFLLGYLAAHNHWTTRMHGRMPGRDSGGRRMPPSVGK